ncbi:hypothetical protein ACH3XW_47700 [Acanthocheilonema viteae]
MCRSPFQVQPPNVYHFRELYSAHHVLTDVNVHLHPIHNYPRMLSLSSIRKLVKRYIETGKGSWIDQGHAHYAQLLYAFAYVRYVMYGRMYML